MQNCQPKCALRGKSNEKYSVLQWLIQSFISSREDGDGAGVGAGRRRSGGVLGVKMMVISTFVKVH